MPTRNTAVLQQIIESFGDLLISSPHALARLERRFESFLVVAGDVTLIASQAEQLRLAITIHRFDWRETVVVTFSNLLAAVD